MIVSFHQEATQRAFSQFDLYFPFISNMLPGTQSLSLSCFVFPARLVSLFSYVLWSIHLQDCKTDTKHLFILDWILPYQAFCFNVRLCNVCVSEEISEDLKTLH